MLAGILAILKGYGVYCVISGIAFTIFLVIGMKRMEKQPYDSTERYDDEP